MIVKRRSDFLLSSPRSFLITIVSFQNTKYSILKPFSVFRNLWTPLISMSFMTLCFTPMQHGFITRSLFLSLILQRCPILYTLALLRVRIWRREKFTLLKILLRDQDLFLGIQQSLRTQCYILDRSSLTLLLRVMLFQQTSLLNPYTLQVPLHTYKGVLRVKKQTTALWCIWAGTTLRNWLLRCVIWRTRADVQLYQTECSIKYTVSPFVTSIVFAWDMCFQSHWWSNLCSSHARIWWLHYLLYWNRSYGVHVSQEHVYVLWSSLNSLATHHILKKFIQDNLSFSPPLLSLFKSFKEYEKH